MDIARAQMIEGGALDRIDLANVLTEHVHGPAEAAHQCLEATARGH